MASAVLVHEADHQHFAAFGVLNDRGHEPVELCEIHALIKCPETKNPAGRVAGQSVLGCVIVVDLSAAPLARRVTVMMVVMVMPVAQRTS